MIRVLLHVCCGPCSTEAVDRLKEDYEVVLFYPNSNIYPREEWERRLKEVRKLAELKDLKLYVGDYKHKKWLDFISGFEDEKEGGKRCEKCFEFNFKECVKKAKELGIEKMTSTLTISPYKNSDKIFEIGKKVCGKEVKFLDRNFKKQKGYERSVKKSKQLKMYRQDYCGCEFSLRI